ncbi:MAG TPA: hypothetical protein PKE51_12655, partial [Gemmatimonadaceae bacterium]|nr:hypothetical protein [Gemmatimonadaceae bacterium]
MSLVPRLVLAHHPSRGRRPTTRPFRRRLALLAVLLPLAPTRVMAQSPWTTVQQAATWYGAFVDQAITDRTALWFDGQWRPLG